MYPAEVEAALDEHASVISSCVFGVPDADLGAVPHAVVQAAGELTEDALRAHLADRLVAYKQPRTYAFVDHPLRDDSGKVRRSDLRAEHLARLPAGE